MHTSHGVFFLFTFFSGILFLDLVGAGRFPLSFVLQMRDRGGRVLISGHVFSSGAAGSGGWVWKKNIRLLFYCGTALSFPRFQKESLPGGGFPETAFDLRWGFMGVAVLGDGGFGVLLGFCWLGLAWVGFARTPFQWNFWARGGSEGVVVGFFWERFWRRVGGWRGGCWGCVLSKVCGWGLSRVDLLDLI